jgi:hypothetical protein
MLILRLSAVTQSRHIARISELKGHKSHSGARPIGAISFGATSEFAALQAADLIAWFYKTERETYRDHSSGICHAVEKQPEEDGNLSYRVWLSC